MQAGKGFKPDAIMFGGTAGDVAVVHVFIAPKTPSDSFGRAILCTHECVQFVLALTRDDVHNDEIPLTSDLITDYAGPS
jgi:hypothetical protein